MNFSWGFLYLAPEARPVEEKWVLERGGVRAILTPVSSHEQAAQVAAQYKADGVRFIELCGAFGHLGAGQVIEATNKDIPIALCTRDEGAQFLWGTRKQFRSFNFYAPGLKFHWAYVFLAQGSDPANDRLVIDHGGLRTSLVAVPDVAVAQKVAKQLVADGIQFIELCGGFGHRGVCQVVDAIDGKVVVSVATVASESSQKLAKMSEAANAG